MKTAYLFPYRYKWVSGIVFAITLIIHVLALLDNGLFNGFEIKLPVFAIIDQNLFADDDYFVFTRKDVSDEILMLLFVMSGLIFAFSKQKIEDEMTSKIRLDSLVWATYVNYAVFMLCVIFIYGLVFVQAMVFAMFTHLLFFIIRFNWKMYQLNHTTYEE